jgi:acylphosphatase
MRKEICFYGRVQGVGFRYRASYAAKNLGLTGWVRNEYDGTVLAQVQGDELSMMQWIHQLASDQYIGIEHYDEKLIPEESEYDFQIMT